MTSQQDMRVHIYAADKLAVGQLTASRRSSCMDTQLTSKVVHRPLVYKAACRRHSILFDGAEHLYLILAD
jgi:hypothetical protein